MTESKVEHRGPQEYKWTVACSPSLTYGHSGRGVDVYDTVMARCTSCGSHTGEYPMAVRGVPARVGREVDDRGAGEPWQRRFVPLGLGWVDSEVLMEWCRRHIDSSIESMRRMADGS